MKKVVLTSLLSLASVAPFIHAPIAAAQAPAGQAAASGQVQMSQEEYAAYNSANTQTSPAAKAAAFEDYLKKYPNSAVKADVLNQMLYAYTQAGDQANTLATADRVLAIDPNNIRALTLEVYYRRADADKLTDPAAKSAALDKVAAYANTAIGALNGPAPKGMTDADWAALKKSTFPTFESAVADDAMANKDNAHAIQALKAEIASDPDDTKKPSPVLQDVYTLAQAYQTSTPPDYLNCAWYAARAAAFAPEPYKTTINQLGTYCYVKYHGNKTGYDQLGVQAQTSIDPPANLSTTVTPAPKPADIVANLIATTPDLATLAPGDREYVLVNGAAVDPKTNVSYADEAFNAVKGKVAKFPDVLVISATANKVMIAASDDAVQSKTADFEFDLKTALKDSEIPTVGSKVTLIGTYTSYTTNPIMIIMSDAELVLPKKETPVRRPVRRR